MEVQKLSTSTALASQSRHPDADLAVFGDTPTMQTDIPAEARAKRKYGGDSRIQRPPRGSSWIMAKQPIFKTPRLTLKPRTLDDLAACLAMDRDPEVTKFIPGPWSDPVRHEAFVRERIAADFGAGAGYWSVFQDVHPDRFLGWVFLIPEDGSPTEMEIGWRFKRQAWGRGYATEASKVVLNYGLQTLGLDRVVADVHPNNSGSISVALKIGMIDEGLQMKDDGYVRVFAAHRVASRLPDIAI